MKMAKKKKKKKHESVLDTLDYEIEQQYADIIRDIEEIQYEVYLADKKQKKKNKKKAKKKYGRSDAGFLIESGDVKSRINAVYKLTDETFSERLLSTLNDIKPIVVIIARLTCALICAILSIDAVKANLTMSSLDMINKIYTTCLSIGKSQV